MTKTELKTTLLLAGIYITRMLGLFLIFPTFSLLAQDLVNSTPEKIGLALGIYSLAQAILQIPAGWLSDIIGRKKVLYVGLTLFFIGSLLASFSKDLDILIFARLLQGMGAISAVCLAYVGDSIRDSEQGKAMMIIGMAIGSAFMLALVLGSFISSYWGLTGLFRTTALLALLALWFTYLLPTPAQTFTTFKPREFLNTLRDSQLQTVSLQVALLHMTFAASFFLLPLMLPVAETQWLYVIVYIVPLIITALIVAPLVRNRDEGVARLPYFWGILAVSLIGMAALPLFSTPAALAVAMTIFFSGFTLVETLLPARLFQFADESARGATSGIFALYQFGGSFLGGLLGAKCYTLFAVNNGTIQSSFYILALPAIAVVIASIFTNKQPKVTHG